MADSLIHIQQFTAQFTKAVKAFDLALRFAQCRERSERFSDRLAMNLAGKTEVRAVAGLVGLMTTALGFPTAATDRSNGPAAKIPQIDDSGQNGGAKLFECV